MLPLLMPCKVSTIGDFDILHYSPLSQALSNYGIVPPCGLIGTSSSEAPSILPNASVAFANCYGMPSFLI